MARQMPKQGFYVLKHGIYSGIQKIIYTTGMRSGGGHKSWRSVTANGKPPPQNPSDWNTLRWTCVPGKEELQRDYTYYAGLGPALKAY